MNMLIDALFFEIIKELTKYDNIICLMFFFKIIEGLTAYYKKICLMMYYFSKL